MDALFFFQLLLPFCDPAQSGVDGNPRLPYYTDVEKYSNASAAFSGQGSSYGHCWKPTSAGELSRFDAILLHDGVLRVSMVLCTAGGMKIVLLSQKKLHLP